MPARFLTATSAWSVSLHPDATRLAYVCDRDGWPRLFVADLDGGNARVIDTGAEPVQEAHWSFDGGWIALMVAPGGSPRTEVWAVRPDGSDLRKVSGTRGGASYLGPWTHHEGVLAVAQTTLPTGGVALLHDLVSGADIPIAGGGQPVVLDVDARRTLALIRRGPRGARSVWVIDLVSRRETELRWGPEVGSTDLGRLSPDGRTAFLKSNTGRDLFALFAVDLETAPGEPLQAELLAERADAELEDLIVTADGEMAALLWNRMGRSECDFLYFKHGHRRDLLLPEPVAHGGSFSKDGRFLALTLEGPTHPRAVHVLDIEQGTWRRVTSQPPDWDPPTTTPTLEHLRAPDGVELTGWLYRAASGSAAGGSGGGGGGAGAAVLHLHGGPESQERPTYNPLFQALAAHGIAVFAPNVRGSSGFGRVFVNADNRDKRWGAISDVAACARYLVDAGLATPQTLACAGRSYGGYLTLAALVFHPQLFAAGVDICGMADFATFYRDTEPWIAVAAYPKYGHPLADAALLRALSPVHHFDALRAPLLVVHGENDTNVPVGEARRVVEQARARGLPVEFLLFSGEGHELLKRENRERFVTTTVTWLKRQLLGAYDGPAEAMVAD